MARADLPGQSVMFPELEPFHAPAGADAAAALEACGGRVLALPRKPTCTVPEASAATGVSERQLRNWVDDGTLLAINAARCPVGARAGRESKLDRWRIVVRRAPGYDAEDMRAFLTLEELLVKASNMEAGR